MSSVRLYYDDSYTTRFEAVVAARSELAGRPALELETSYFYPESGGQEADRGTLGGTPVLDVQAGDDGRVWHVIAETGAGAGDPGPGARLAAEIDWARRFDHMQQHTGQHVLSAAFERVLGAATLSSHLGEERSSIEVALNDADWRAIERVEEAANRVLWEDRPIERHWVDDEGVKRFALRKATKVTGRIRVIEIPDWDVSACGGTHTRRTGEVGAVKVVRWDRVRGNVRFEFLCGARALRDHAWRTEALLEAAKRRTLKDRDLVAHLERVAAEGAGWKKRAEELGKRLAEIEARERVGEPPRAVAAWFADRPRDDVRVFVLACLAAGAPWVAAGCGAPDTAVIVGRARGSGPDLREWLPGLLERAGGKGGGSPELLQVGAGNAASAESASGWISAELAARTGIAAA